MIILKSTRAKKLLDNLTYFTHELSPRMRKFPGEGPEIYFELNLEDQIVKKLSFSGKLDDGIKVLLESMAILLINRPIQKLDSLSLRELEAYLRDKNSEPSLSEMTEKEDIYLKKLFQWLKNQKPNIAHENYSFHSEKSRFSDLKLVDKIKEMKAFLNSVEILTLYQDFPAPELIDIEEMTVFINAPFSSEREKELFSKLHLLGVETFKDENLNFIPES